MEAHVKQLRVFPPRGEERLNPDVPPGPPRCARVFLSAHREPVARHHLRPRHVSSPSLLLYAPSLC